MEFTNLVQIDKIFATYILNFVAYSCALGIIFSVLTFSNIQTLRSLANLVQLAFTNFIKLSIVLALLSLSGVPPLFGFFAKFFLFFILISKGSWLILIFFLIFNLFALYFYLQFIRFLFFSKKTKLGRLIAGNVKITSSLATYWLSFCWILCFGCLFIESFFIILCSFFA